MKATLRSNAIHCENCAQRVRDTFAQHAGVRSIEVNPQTKLVSLDFDPAATSLPALAERLGSAGYPVDESSEEAE